MACFIQVEELLTSYLKDVGITEEQFVMACEAGSNNEDQTKVADRVSYVSSQSACYSISQLNLSVTKQFSIESFFLNY